MRQDFGSNDPEGGIRYLVKLVKGERVRCKKYEKITTEMYVDGWEGETEVECVEHHFTFEHPYADEPNVISDSLARKAKMKNISMVFPTAKFPDMITPGISISNTRIAMLHINGAMTDLVSFIDDLQIWAFELS